MTDDKLKSIEEYARTLPNPIFAMDVEQLVADVRAWRRWAEENWYAGVVYEGTDEELRSLVLAIENEY